MPDISLKNAFGKKEKSFESHWNLAERIYRLQIIKQLTRERHMAHGAEEYNESKKKIISHKFWNKSWFKFTLDLTLMKNREFLRQPFKTAHQIEGISVLRAIFLFLYAKGPDQYSNVQIKI